VGSNHSARSAEFKNGPGMNAHLRDAIERSAQIARTATKYSINASKTIP
jgi:hypothetical protein